MKKYYLKCDGEFTKEEKDLIEKIILKYYYWAYFGVVLIFVGIVLMFMRWFIGLPFMLVGILLIAKRMHPLTIDYGIEDKKLRRFKKIKYLITDIDSSNKKWEALREIEPHIYQKREFGKSKDSDYFIKSNIPYRVLDLTTRKMIFLPNIIIFINNRFFTRSVRFLDYDHFSFEQDVIKTVEKNEPDKEVVVLGHDWFLIDPNDQSLRRRKDNGMIYVTRYDRIKLNLDTYILTIFVANLVNNSKK